MDQHAARITSKMSDEPAPRYGVSHRPGIVVAVADLSDQPVGRIAALTRYPVKSIVGEDLESVDVSQRGLEGDRLWAVRDIDGKLGSGKNTRRFRRMPDLLELVSSYDDDLVPTVRFPDGRELRGDGGDVHRALSMHVGRPVTLDREEDVPHFDEGPLHLLTSSWLCRLSELHGAAVDRRRLRPNLVIDTGEDPQLDEADWVDRELAIGDDVTARVRDTMVRCAMVGHPQVGLEADPSLLDTISRVNDLVLGLVLDVRSPGAIRLGDAVRQI